MTTVIQASNRIISPTDKPGHLATLTDYSGTENPAQKHNNILQMASLLQCSLNIDDILSQFSKQVNKLITHDSFSYINEAHHIQFSQGKTAKHSCTYELTIEGEKLGALTLTRAKRFSHKEIETLEELICTLHYPIRNSIMYGEAINAAHRDPLTGIGNRAALMLELHREIELAHRHHRSLGLVMIDVDHFKTINDQHGHLAGDRVLQSLVKCIEKTVRISDMFFRFGGEEFVVLMPETHEAGVLRTAKRIRRRIEKLETKIGNQLIKSTVSMGITTLLDNDNDKTLITRADEAMYQSKREGRNCIRVATAQDY